MYFSRYTVLSPKHTHCFRPSKFIVLNFFELFHIELYKWYYKCTLTCLTVKNKSQFFFSNKMASWLCIPSKGNKIFLFLFFSNNFVPKVKKPKLFTLKQNNLRKFESKQKKIFSFCFQKGFAINYNNLDRALTELIF